MEQPTHRPTDLMLSATFNNTAVPHARWLPWAKTAVALHVLLSVVMFMLGTAVLFGILSSPCETDCFALQLAPSEAAGLSSLGVSLELYAIYQIAQEYFYLLSFGLTAAIIFSKLVRRQNQLAWYGLLAAFALISIGTVLLPETAVAAITLGPEWHFLHKLLKSSSNAGFMAFCLLFPDGRFVPRWTRWPMAATVVWMAIWVLLPLPALDPDGEIGIFLNLPLLALIVGVQIYRYRRVSTPVQRQQTKWFVLGFALILIVVFIWTILFVILPFAPGSERLARNVIGQGIMMLFPAAVAVCIGIALLRYRLWDIDVIINRTLVYGGLTLVIVAAYTLIVGGLGIVLQSRGNFVVALLATGLIAVLFQPLRERLQRGVNRLMFGERDDPYAVLSKLGMQLQTTTTPEMMLQSVVDTIAETLKLPYVAIKLTDGQERLDGAATGTAIAETTKLVLRYQNDTVGHLVVSPRSPDEPFTDQEQRLLADMAAQTGAVAYSVRLTAVLQRSREKLVLTREEERRRIRRDLHDELGPTLASQTFVLDAILDLLETNPQEAARLARGLKLQNQETVAEIRRLVYELRPPALDELGLVSALQAHVVQLNHAKDLRIRITARPDPLPTLSAAVEVAAYRIALEGVTNVVRHAKATRCDLLLCLRQSTLHIQISDNGVGLPQAVHAGVGLNSMRERAEELGGSLTVVNDLDGVQITAVLPMQQITMEKPR